MGKTLCGLCLISNQQSGESEMRDFSSDFLIYSKVYISLSERRYHFRIDILKTCLRLWFFLSFLNELIYLFIHFEQFEVYDKILTKVHRFCMHSLLPHMHSLPTIKFPQQGGLLQSMNLYQHRFLNQNTQFTLEAILGIIYSMEFVLFLNNKTSARTTGERQICLARPEIRSLAPSALTRPSGKLPTVVPVSKTLVGEREVNLKSDNLYLQLCDLNFFLIHFSYLQNKNYTKPRRPFKHLNEVTYVQYLSQLLAQRVIR